MKGGLAVFVSVRVLVKLAKATPPKATGFFMQMFGYPLGILGLIGVLYLVAGLLFLFSPSMRAFFQLQRERKRMLALLQQHFEERRVRIEEE